MRVGGRAEAAAPVTADGLVALVRVHADRVHDFVRRQGCSPEAAPGVVEASALDLVAVAARGPAVPGALVGRWFALAGEHAHRAGLDGAWLPRGSGPLADDAQQELLAAGLERRAERGRSALLLRDAYDLPASSVAAALELDRRGAERLVGAARLELLPDVFDSGSPAPAPHPVDEAALAGLATGPPTSREQTRAARHVRACGACSDVVVAQDDVRRLLAGLAVVALPDRTREQLLERVAVRARADLPAAVVVTAAFEADDESRRVLSPGPVLLALLLAVAAGAGLGVLLSRPEPVKAAAISVLAPVTAPPATPLPAAEAPTPPASPPLPRTTVFTYSPTPVPTTPAPAPATVAAAPTTTPPPSAAPTTPPPRAAVATVTVSPQVGAAGATLTVTGTGFAPGSTVVVSFLDPRGRPAGDTAAAVAGPDGRLDTTLQAGAPDAPAGRYTVQAGNGQQSARTGYTVL